MSTAEDHMLADLRMQAEAMDGPAAMPRSDDGEPVFDEPWQGRAVAMTVETLGRLSLPWEAFRTGLIDAISAEPERNYYESWLLAFEDLVAGAALATSDQIDGERMAAASYRTSEQAHDDLEVFPIPLGPTTAEDLLRTIFRDHWSSIRFGPVIPGAVYELGLAEQPGLSMRDGYLTIDLGGSHLHLCVGEHVGAPDRPVDPALAHRRKCAQVELQRVWVGDAPRSWMVRLFSGDGDQMITVLLPSPFLDDDQQILDEPDFGRLAIWDQLRAEYLGLPPDPHDRLATHVADG